MFKMMGRLALAILMVVGISGCAGVETDQAAAQTQTTDEQAVRAAVDQWIVVLNAMLNGDPVPFAALYSHADDAMYMGAEGTYRIGWDAIYADWTAQAAASTGGTVEAINVHIVVVGDMAMAAHITTGPVRQPDGTESQNYVRETSVLRRENGQWLMIGHHADGIPYWEEEFGRGSN